MERYQRLNQYLMKRLGERTLKICIDGGFTCPNRDGTKSHTGCIFCGERGSGEHIHYENAISEQVKNYFKSYKSTRANRFIAYFQNFTNTYDTIINLKTKYDSALIDDRIVGLAISTRPDCINTEIVQLIKSYQKKYMVWVELGLQTANEATGKLINRCYSNVDFSNAVKLLNKNAIDVVTHIMVGLPNENDFDLKNTIHFLNSHSIQGLKIHSTYVIQNTELATMYYQGTYIPLTLEHYLDCLIEIITHISPNIIIHRISGDAPKNLLIAPLWNSHKKLVLNGLDKLLEEKNLYQGIYYKEILQ